MPSLAVTKAPPRASSKHLLSHHVRRASSVADSAKRITGSTQRLRLNASFEHDGTVRSAAAELTGRPPIRRASSFTCNGAGLAPVNRRPPKRQLLQVEGLAKQCFPNQARARLPTRSWQLSWFVDEAPPRSALRCEGDLPAQRSWTSSALKFVRVPQ